jgi:phosphatidylinositol glycan class F
MYVHHTSKNNSSKLEIFAMSMLEFLVSTLVVHLIVVSFGASLVESITETFLLSALLSAICVMPSLLIVEHSSPLEVLQRLFIHREFVSRLEQKCVQVATGCVAGAWLGAFALPLDWDRWWQEWPLSCVFGCLIGAVIGFAIANFNSYYWSNKKRKLHL